MTTDKKEAIMEEHALLSERLSKELMEKMAPFILNQQNI